MPAEGRENPLLKKGNSDAFFREKYLTKNIGLPLAGIYTILLYPFGNISGVYIIVPIGVDHVSEGFAISCHRSQLLKGK